MIVSYLVAMLVGAFTATMTLESHSFEDCAERNFEPKACVVSKLLEAEDLQEKDLPRFEQGR